MTDTFMGIPQPLSTYRFKINFFNPVINESLCPVITGYNLDILNGTFELLVDASDYTNLAYYINEISQQALKNNSKNIFLTSNMKNSIGIEFLTASGSSNSICAIVLDQVEIDDLVISGDYRDTSKTLKVKIKCKYSNLKMYSSEMARNAKYGESLYDE